MYICSFGFRGREWKVENILCSPVLVCCVTLGGGWGFSWLPLIGRSLFRERRWGGFASYTQSSWTFWTVLGWGLPWQREQPVRLLHLGSQVGRRPSRRPLQRPFRHFHLHRWQPLQVRTSPSHFQKKRVRLRQRRIFEKTRKAHHRIGKNLRKTRRKTSGTKTLQERVQERRVCGKKPLRSLRLLVAPLLLQVQGVCGEG